MTDLAIIVPCFNEEISICDTLDNLKESILHMRDLYDPIDIKVYVYDNNSTDNTVKKVNNWKRINDDVEILVKYCLLQGKGNVLRQAFTEITAKVYGIIDGDNTYDTKNLDEMYELVVRDHTDMVTGDRLSTSYFKENKRPFHNFGNKLMRDSINRLFNKEYKDILSGFRLFSYSFVKTFPILSEGFSIETEMNIHAAANKMTTAEVNVRYKDRIAGSVSKLKTIPDGIKVLKQLFMMTWLYKPLKFYGLISAILCLLGVGFNVPVFIEYFATSEVRRFPTLIVGCFLLLTGILAFFTGQTQESDNVRQRQQLRLKYMEKSKEISNAG